MSGSDQTHPLQGTATGPVPDGRGGAQATTEVHWWGADTDHADAPGTVDAGRGPDDQPAPRAGWPSPWGRADTDTVAAPEASGPGSLDDTARYGDVPGGPPGQGWRRSVCVVTGAVAGAEAPPLPRHGDRRGGRSGGGGRHDRRGDGDGRHRAAHAGHHVVVEQPRRSRRDRSHRSSGQPVDWTATAAAVEPSVVAITVGSQSSGAEAQGSGIILDTSGHVLTNNHVATATDGPITVTLTDQRTYNAKIVGTDPSTDLAVLAIANPPKDLKPASLGDSDKLAVGQPVMAVGNPLGLADTVTTGIVSALDRPVTTQSLQRSGLRAAARRRGHHQRDPDRRRDQPRQLRRRAGHGQRQVIGINSSIASLSGSSAFGGDESGSIGLGFAIPINEAKTIAQQLISSGKVKHPYRREPAGRHRQGRQRHPRAAIVAQVS